MSRATRSGPWCAAALAAALASGCLDVPTSGLTPRGVPVLRYDLDEGSGATAADRGAVAPAVDLSVDISYDPPIWGDGLVRFETPGHLVSTLSAEKLVEAVVATEELSVEIWLSAAFVAQPADVGPERILTISRGENDANLTIGQQDDHWAVRLRTDQTDSGGAPELVSDAVVVADALTHLVVTRADTGVTSLYLDGALDTDDVAHAGTLLAWDRLYRVSLGNEDGAERAWLGELHDVAAFDHALTADEVAARFAAGPPAPRAR